MGGSGAISLCFESVSSLLVESLISLRWTLPIWPKTNPLPLGKSCLQILHFVVFIVKLSKFLHFSTGKRAKQLIGENIIHTVGQKKKMPCQKKSWNKMNQFHGIFFYIFHFLKVSNFYGIFFFVKLIHLISRDFWPGDFEIFRSVTSLWTGPIF